MHRLENRQPSPRTSLAVHLPLLTLAFTHPHTRLPSSRLLLPCSHGTSWTLSADGFGALADPPPGTSVFAAAQADNHGYGPTAKELKHNTLAFNVFVALQVTRARRDLLHTHTHTQQQRH